jgi:PAS domain S-box-containing protein
MKITKKIIASLAFLALLVVLVMTLALSSFRQIESSAAARKRTFILLNQADELLSAVIDAETGQRGYLLTGDDAFLAPYMTVKDSVSGQLKDLRQRTKISAGQKHLEALVPLVDAKMAEMSRIITLRRNGDMAAVTAAVKSGEGLRLMDAIRAEMRRFMKIEEAALIQRDAEFQAKLHTMFIIILFTGLLMFLLALSFAYMIYRQAQQRLNDAVHLETEHLLKSQEELNSQLQQTNDELQVAGETTQKLLNELEVAQLEMERQNTELQRTQHELETQQVELELQNEELGRVQSKTEEQNTELQRSQHELETQQVELELQNVELGRVQAESETAMTKLRESEEQLAVTLNSIGDAVIATDAEARVTRINPVAELLTGWTLVEALGKPVDEVFHIINKDTRQPAPIPIMDAILHGKIQGLANHTVLIARNGSECDIADSCAPIRSLDNQVVGAVLVFRNVSEEYAVQQSLSDSAALVRTILNTVVDGIITISAHGGVIETVNPAAEQMFGYTEAELEGQNFSLLIPELGQDQRDGSLEYYRASEEARAVGLGREVMGRRRKDGSLFPLEMAISEMMLNGQRYFTGILRDSTIRKQVEAGQKQLDQRLRDQQFYTRSLFECNIDAIMTTDTFGIITDVNKQMELLTDCTRDELIGAPFKNYFTDPELAGMSIKQVLSEKKVTNFELTARTRDGWETVVSLNATTFYDRDRKLQGVFAAARDVTERKQLDRELESARFVAEKANLAKSDFLSSMSHELRTPLGAILGFAQLLESGIPPPSPSQKRSIDQILKAGWYLLELINEILDLALIESGKLSLSLEPVSLVEVLHECEVMVEPQAQQRGISMVFTRFETSYFVIADRTRVKQLLLNLLSNAIKYNRADGSVVVTCTPSPPDAIRISVRDTGAGLNPEQLTQLFQPFNRLGQTDGEEGTGIGLVVCKRLVELMDGVIGVESTVGEGSVFWLELKRTEKPHVAAHSPEFAVTVDGHTQGAARLYTLLYVEDNPANLMLVEDLIARRPDLRLLSAREAISGIDIARASLPDAILMDINLPGISGIDALKILAEDPLTAHIPVIALSANAIPRDIEKGLEAGFFRYLTKPIKVNEFMDTLDLVLEYAKNVGAGP